MIPQLLDRYGTRLDQTMREVVDVVASKTPALGVMLQYPLGWTDADGQPYNQPTGKRIRPTVLLLCAEASGGSWEEALPAAAAVELLHNFSLIHDDIQDISEIRHSRPTVWKVWGEAISINTGDAMFALSYVALERLGQHLPPATVIDAWRVFNETILELTRGQHLDMSFETAESVKVDEYLSMITGKTAALLSASCELGALAATRNAELAKDYAEFGLNLGLAFQIRDDILGIWGDPSQTGKSAATDIMTRKKSLPVLYGLANSTSLVALYEQATFGDAEVTEAVRLLDEVSALDYAKEQEGVYFRRSVTALERAQPKDPAASELSALVEALFGRVY